MADDLSHMARSCCSDLALDIHETVRELQEMDATAFEEQHGPVDRRLGQYCQRLEACRRFLEIHRPAIHAPVNFGEVFREWNPSTGQVAVGIEGRRQVPVTADSRQMLACLELIAANAAAGAPRDFEIRVYGDAVPPSILIQIPGEPRLGPTLDFGHGLELDWRAIAARWAAATGGGLLYEDNLGLVLELEGQQEWDEGIPGFDTAEDCVRKAERAMRPWRGAIGNTDAGYAAPEEATALYIGALERALRCLEQASSAIT